MQKPPQELEQNELLSECVYDAMNQLGYKQLRKVHCCAFGSTVLLTGRTESFYLKQVAQTVAAKVEGVERIINQMEVVTTCSGGNGEA